MSRAFIVALVAIVVALLGLAVAQLGKLRPFESKRARMVPLIAGFLALFGSIASDWISGHV